MTSQGLGVSYTVPRSPVLPSSAQAEGLPPPCSPQRQPGALGHAGAGGALSTCAGLISNVILQRFCYSNYQHHMDRNLMLPSGTFKMYL